MSDFMDAVVRAFEEKGMPVERNAVLSTNRCDHPGCLSRVTATYFVGLGGMPAFYCADHAPTQNTEGRPE